MILLCDCRQLYGMFNSHYTLISEYLQSDLHIIFCKYEEGTCFRSHQSKLQHAQPTHPDHKYFLSVGVTVTKTFCNKFHNLGDNLVITV